MEVDTGKCMPADVLFGSIFNKEEEYNSIAPYVKLCLQSGRYEDLILAPTANKRRHNAEANAGST